MTRNKKIELSTIIGSGTVIEGDLKVDGGVRVDGLVKGKIESNGFVTIGPSGEALADIKAKESLISGRVNGNIDVEEGLELDKTAQVQGNLSAKLLTIHAGAMFFGSSSMKHKGNFNKSEKIKQVSTNNEINPQ